MERTWKAAKAAFKPGASGNSPRPSKFLRARLYKNFVLAGQYGENQKMGLLISSQKVNTLH